MTKEEEKILFEIQKKAVLTAVFVLLFEIVILVVGSIISLFLVELLGVAIIIVCSQFVLIWMIITVYRAGLPIRLILLKTPEVVEDE